MTKLVVTMDSAKDRFTRARKAACSADRLSAALYDRLAAETLLAVKGQPAERAATMLVRMAVCLEARGAEGLAGTRQRAAGQTVVAAGDR